MRKNLSVLLALVMAFTVLCGNLGAIAFAEPIGAITEPIEGTVQLESDLYGNSAVGSKAAVTSANQTSIRLALACRSWKKAETPLTPRLRCSLRTA